MPRLRSLPDPTGPPDQASPRTLADHFDEVARWAQRLGGPEVDAEDVVQDVFIVALPKLAAFRGDAKLGTWLFRITERVARSHRRKVRRRRWLGALFGDHAPTVALSHAAAARDVETLHAADELYRALDTLDERHRTAFVLFALEDVPAERIAELQGTSVPTVWVRVHRARKKLRQALVEQRRRSGGVP